MMSFFLFWFWFVGESRHFSGAGSSLRSDAGLEDTVDASCGGDVEDEFVMGFDDNPGPTRGAKFSVWPKNILPLLGQPWFLTAGPLTGKSVFFAEFSK